MATTKSPKRKNPPKRTGTIVQVQFPEDLLQLVDREVARVSQERGGEPVGRSEVIRALVRRVLGAAKT